MPASADASPEPGNAAEPAADAPETEGGEEVREGYGPMAELLAEAADPVLTIEAEIPPDDTDAEGRPEKVTFIVSPGEPDEIDPEDLKFNVDPELLPKSKRVVGGRKGGPVRGPRKVAGPRSAGAGRTARPRGRKKAD
jgi:hypothetical protein